MKLRKLCFALFLPFLIISCQTGGGDTGLQVNFEEFTLDNGLEVVFHTDRSDPVVAVALTFHVGSAREKPGRTGFAHLFEHLLFLESENLGKGGLDIMSNRIGGSGANGSTSRDRTNYFQTVPKDALEKMIWAEADKMGWFINTVTESVVAKEKQVVKNEKRQGVDNNPYGHTNYVIGKNLYPEGHPYNWQVIGSLADLDAATLADVKEFYNKWYVPNNATLVIAGDFDVEQAKAWVKKYFDEIPRGDEITPMQVDPVVLTESKKLYHEDNFARLPRLTMTWPGVRQYHPDAYPLNVLTQLLTRGKKSPFYKVLVEDKKLTSSVNMFNNGSELAGEVQLSSVAFAGKDLDELAAAVDEAFTKFETDGIADKDLERIKAGQETNFYNRNSSVLGKAFNLAQYSIFAGDPGYITEDIEKILAVTKEDVMRVYNQYIKDKHYVATSFVPKDRTEFMLEGSEKAEVVEEKIVQGAEQEFVVTSEEYERTPSKIDRSVEPPYGESPTLRIPQLWTDGLSNGMSVYGIEDTEMPLVQFNIRIKGGLLLDNPNKIGVANLITDLMMEGTKNKTPLELEEEIEQLGATINMSTGREFITVSGNTLKRNYQKTMDIVSEILLEPRWDENEFDLIKKRTLNTIRQRASNPNSVAANVYNKLLYGKDHIFSNPTIGTISSVESITIDDLKSYYEENFSPSLANMHVVGDINTEEVMTSLSRLNAEWTKKDVQIPEYSLPAKIDRSKVYFVDIPNAKQSVIRVGYLALSQKDDDYFPANIMNFKLGGGGFASELTQVLREQKGYTYGVGSGFSGTDVPGPFSVSTSVRTNVTLESLELIKDMVATYKDDFSDSYLEDTKSFMIKSSARRFETLGAKLGMLQNISAYDFPFDYPVKQQEIVRGMTVDNVKSLADKYMSYDKMIYLVVGDAKTQVNRLNALGFGAPELIDRDAAPVTSDTFRR